MAIDEHDTFAGVAEDADTTDEGATASAADGRADLSLDDLRHRLDSPLYAREPGLAASSQVPGLRELTWDHVTNPTTSHPVVVPGESIFEGDGDGSPRPAPLKLDEVLARPAVTLKPLEPIDPITPPATTTSGALAVAVSPVADVELVEPDVATDVASAPATDVASAPATAPAAPPSAARAPLPSFADIIATPSAMDDRLPGPLGVSDSSGVDSLIKPIDERPPVARDTDPFVDGLAELIVKSTPSAGMPRVADLREVSRGDTGMVPTIAAPPLDPPVLDAKVEFANVSTTVPVVPPPPPGSEAAADVSGERRHGSVEAEMNRLAFLPDQDDEAAGPVEVPEIAYSDVRSAEPVAATPAPALSLSQGDMYQPRPSVSPVRHNYNDLLTGSVGVVAPTRRRRQRHLVRNFITIVLLLGLVGGGLFAVKHYVLDRIVWAAELEPLATEVAATRGLEFESSVAVEELPPVEYATRIVESVAGYPDATHEIDEAELRALGLANETFDIKSVGLSAMADSPAFYDPTDGTIYVVEKLQPELKEFSLHRALTMALLDQKFGWSTRIADASPAIARGTRALYEGDAMAVAKELLVADGDTTQQKINEQLYSIYAQYSIPVSPAPFVSASTGRFGLALDPYFRTLSPEERNLVETDAAVTDARVLDLRKLLDKDRVEPLVGTARGMLFWYHALAGRVGDDLAWKVALAWEDDETATEPASGAACTDAVIEFDVASRDLVNAAFTQWAAAAPAASQTKVTFGEVDGQSTSVTVRACDPEKVATNDGAFSPSLGGGPLRAEQYAGLLESKDPPTDVVAACMVYSAPSDTISAADERGLVDQVDGWAAPAAHPIDPATRAACEAAG